MKEIKFQAYVPNLGITLEGIAIYSSGMIGMHPDSLDSELPVEYKLIDDAIFDAEGECVMTILEGDEWVFLEDDQYELRVSIDGAEFEPFKLKP